MTIGNFAAYSLDLVNLLRVHQKAGANGSGTSFSVSSSGASDTTQTNTGTSTANSSSSQASPFVLTPVILTLNPTTNVTAAAAFQVYTKASSLPTVSMTADQLKAAQVTTATTPQIAPVDLDAAQKLLEGAESNDDGTISKSNLESLAVSSGSNVAQADALFAELTPNGGDSIDVSQIMDALRGINT